MCEQRNKRQRDTTRQAGNLKPNLNEPPHEGHTHTSESK